MPTNGNAGRGLGRVRRPGRAALPVAMPAGAPAITRSECAAAGAETYVVDGLINDAGRMIAPAVARAAAGSDVSTLKEPYRLEGKKTIGLEIAEQLGWRVPDVIVCPTGGGVGLIGIRKALAELAELGWIGRPGRGWWRCKPTGCAPVVRAFEQGEARPCRGRTPARSRSASRSRRRSAASSCCARSARDGRHGGRRRRRRPAGHPGQAAGRRGVDLPGRGGLLRCRRRLREAGWLAEGDEVVVVNTGGGAQVPETAPADLPVLPLDAPLPVAAG